MQESFSIVEEESGVQKRRWTRWAAVSGFWTFLALLYGNQIYFEMRGMENMNHAWWRIILFQVMVWNVWTILMPFVLHAERRFPIERARWWRALLIHLPLFAVVSAAHTLAHTVLYVIVKPYDVWTGTDPFWTMFVQRLPGKFPQNFLIYGAMVGFGYALDYYEKYREREMRATQLEAQLINSQLQTLKMQLHPHFLFNTLHAISSLVRDQKNKAAVSMIAGLSDLLRHALENSGKQEVSLREELEFLELYLDIQQMRFSDRLKVSIDIEPETLDARVPNLLLQPIVENAIRHGIAPRVSGGLLSLSTRNENGLLEIRVTDDGPGLKSGWRLEQCEGIGLGNTKARLEQLYGADHRFEVRNRSEGGVEAMLVFPFRLTTSEACR